MASTQLLPRWKQYFHGLIAAEISSIVRYCDRLIQWRPVKADSGFLLKAIDCPDKSLVADGDLPDLSAERERRTAVLINGNFNYAYDIEAELRHLRQRMSRTARVVIVLFNPYLDWLYRLATRLHLKDGDPPTTFITLTDIDSISRLAGFERVRTRPIGYCPRSLFGLGSLWNRIAPALPLARLSALAMVVVLRPTGSGAESPSSISVVIPARNEKGNIFPALERMPDLGCETEIIFVEGHSTDGTSEEIARAVSRFGHRWRIVALQQTGKGKADAVRLGFSHARGELLTILDADLTMPPELLPRFVSAYKCGLADFVNGNRIVYPMEGEAMRFLNRLGNVFFAKALSWVLGVRLGDSLCGTKLLARHDYERMIRWRKHFGDFDPFGDFELLFPAAILGLGIIDVPIRYRARTYGTTNISRFRHGLVLLRMVIHGLFRVKLGHIPAQGV